MRASQKICSHLWFDNQAEEATKYYTSIFRDSEILRITRYEKDGSEIHRMPHGSVMSVEFRIEGHRFVALNGGPAFRVNQAISFKVECKDQPEIDYYWEKLSHRGDPGGQQCGWLKDRFGVSWQVVPKTLAAMLEDGDRERADRVMKVMLQMRKLHMSTLEKVYYGELAGSIL